MSDETESKDGKGQGGCCGCCIGCAVIIALLTAFLLGFYIVPALRDNGWSFDVFPRKIKEFRVRLGNTIDDCNYRFIKIKDNVEEAVDDAEDKVDDIEDKIENVAGKVKKTGKKAVKKTEKLIEPLVDDDLEPNLIED